MSDKLFDFDDIGLPPKAETPPDALTEARMISQAQRVAQLTETTVPEQPLDDERSTKPKSLLRNNKPEVKIPYRSISYNDDPNLQLLSRYWNVTLDSQTGKRLEKIVDWAVLKKGVKSQNELLKLIDKTENDNKSLGSGEPLVYRIAMLDHDKAG